MPHLMEPEAEPECAFNSPEKLIKLRTICRISAVSVLQALQLLSSRNNDRGEHLVQDRWPSPVV